jgi:hypothetical protein
MLNELTTKQLPDLKKIMTQKKKDSESDQKKTEINSREMYRRGWINLRLKLEEENPEGYTDDPLWKACKQFEDQVKLAKTGKPIPPDQPGQNEGEEYNIHLPLMNRGGKFRKSEDRGE